MRTRIDLVALALTLIGAALTMGTLAAAAPPRPQGPCDIYGAAGTPCTAAHSTTRALYAAYNGPLYQVKRQSDGKTLDTWNSLATGAHKNIVGLFRKAALKRGLKFGVSEHLGPSYRRT